MAIAGMKSLTAISLFSGCGGMDFGLERTGISIVFSNEIDQDAAASFKQCFPDAEQVVGNIADIKSFPKADLVVGGYPCQSFSMGGRRVPEKDKRTQLYRQFARCLDTVQPKYFIAENVDGLRKLQGGTLLQDQVDLFSSAGTKGYSVNAQVLNAMDYGVPQRRKRMFVVGVRRDLEQVFRFPEPTHGKDSSKKPWLKPLASHGEAIKDLPLWPKGEFYERPHDPDGHFSWYFMSRNRKAPWDGPAYTVVANWRHVTLHPAGPVMKLTWSNLSDGFKQRWDFTEEYEHTIIHGDRPVLENPRRLSWRECARIQGFPLDFEPCGNVESKFSQIGNAVPPAPIEIIARELVSGRGFVTAEEARLQSESRDQLTLWK